MAEPFIALAAVLGPAALLAAAGCVVAGETGARRRPVGWRDRPTRRVLERALTWPAFLGEGIAIFLALHCWLSSLAGVRPAITLALLSCITGLASLTGLAGLVGLAGLAARRERRTPLEGQSTLGGVHTVVAAVLVLALAMLLVERATGRPGWDGWAIFELKARAIHLEGRLDTAVVRDLERFGFAHPDYPPGLSILEALSMDLAGRSMDAIASLWGALCFVALIARLAPWPLVALWVLVVPPFLGDALAARADLLVALAGVMVLEGFLEDRVRTIVLGTVLAVLVKNEGVAIWSGAVIGALVARRFTRMGQASTLDAASPLDAAVPMILAAPAAALPWFVVRWRLGLSTDLASRGLAPLALWPGRMAQVLTSLARELFTCPHGGLGPIGWVVAIAATYLLALAIRRGPSDAATRISPQAPFAPQDPPAPPVQVALVPVPASLQSVLAFLATALAIDLVAYIVFATDLGWLLATSFRRVLSQLAPAMALASVLIVSPGRSTVEGSSEERVEARR